MKTYIYIDVSRKQEYIYNNNRLADNLYRSSIIKAITEEKDIKNIGFLKVSLPRFLSKEEFKEAEIVFTGGGNSVIIFENEELAKLFIRTYSRAILEEYPEIELYISMVSENDEAEHNRIFDKLKQKSNSLKDARRAQFRRWTYGIEEINEFGKGQLVNEKDKTEIYRKSKQYLYNEIEQQLKSYVTITGELSKYKNNGANSYIGIISIDGNKMGDIVSEVKEFNERRELGEEISKIYKEAVVESLKAYKDENKNISILLTPIVMAGDDLCLIVRANQAIEIAAMIIKNIQKISGERKKESILKNTKIEYLTACGGVTIVKAGYPFFEAVKNAEKLCHQAKEFIPVDEHASFLTWNIVKGAILNTDTYVQNIKHNNDKEKFTIKPLRLDNNKSENNIFSYSQILKIIKNINRYNNEVINKKDIISKTSLEALKIEMYSGIENYKLYIDMNKSKGIKQLFQIVNEQLGHIPNEEYLINYGVIKNSKEKEYIYVLNDIIESLTFFENGGGIDE